MISQVVGSSPASSSVLTVWRLLGILSLPLSSPSLLTRTCTLSLSLPPKINTQKDKKSEDVCPLNPSSRIHYCLLSPGRFSLSFGRFKDLRFVRTAELLAGRLPLQPHEYWDVIQKHCMEARQILLNKSVSGLRMGPRHNIINSQEGKLVPSLEVAQFADFSLTSFSVPFLLHSIPPDRKSVV